MYLNNFDRCFDVSRIIDILLLYYYPIYISPTDEENDLLYKSER